MKKNFLSTHELGGLLGVTRQTIRNWIKKGDIRAYHVGQNLKVPIEEVTRLLSYYGLPFPDWLHYRMAVQTDQAPGDARPTWAKKQDSDSSPIASSLKDRSHDIDSRKASPIWPREAGR